MAVMGSVGVLDNILKHRTLSLKSILKLKIHFFQFSIHGTSDRAKVLPSMKYTSNSAQVDFSLDHMATAFASSRFALEVALITTDDASDSMAMKHTTEIDDEYTPGVFTVREGNSTRIFRKSGMSAILYIR